MSESKVPYRAGGGPVVPLTLAVAKPDLVARAHAMLKSLLPSSRNLEYIAAPFTSDNEETQRARLRAATQYAARPTADSSNLFSPLTHSEALQSMAQPLPASRWYSLDLAVLSGCSRMRVLRLHGWDDSLGVTMEVEYAKMLGMIVSYESPLHCLSGPVDAQTRHGECVVCGQAATLTGDWCSVCATFVAEYRAVGSGNLV